MGDSTVSMFYAFLLFIVLYAVSVGIWQLAVLFRKLAARMKRNRSRSSEV